MDEYNSGMDPEVKRYFKKIMRSFGAGIIWLLVISTMAFSFKLALVNHHLRWQNMVFYGLFAVSLGGLLFYLQKIWRKKE